MTGSRHGTRLSALALVLATSLGVAACSASTTSGSSGGQTLQGGTAYFAEQPLSTPTYIFPLISGENYSSANTADLQTLLYEPLYWYGDKGNPSVDYRLSVGDQPVYSDGNRVVTITLKHYVWSDGETVSARDVIFWINLLKANKADWASYVPGGFPDNVVSWTAVGKQVVRLQLNRAYNPIWFTDNELSQITPLPMSWDSACAPGDSCFLHTPRTTDVTPEGARLVY